jgi:hypothetical protein
VATPSTTSADRSRRSSTGQRDGFIAGASSPAVTSRFDVGGGRMMFMECGGTGSPTVVLVSGQRGSAEDWSIVTDGVNSPPVFSLVADKTRVCADDRPGTPVGDGPGRSDPIEQPRPRKASSRTCTRYWRRQTWPSRS